MKALLLYPPGATALSQPYTALPYLAAAARAHGHEVSQHDLGIQFINSLISDDATQMASAHWNAPSSRRNLSPDSRRVLDTALRRFPNHASLLAGVRRAKGILGNAEKFFEPDALYQAFQDLNLAFFLLTADSAPLAMRHLGLDCLTFTFPWTANTPLQCILASCEQIAFGPMTSLRRFIEEAALPAIASENPGAVGLSISFGGQLFPGIALAMALRRRFPAVRLCIGGTAITRLLIGGTPTEGLLKAVLSLVDAGVVYEGETALVSLLDRFDKGQPLDDVPNLVRLKADTIAVADARSTEDVNALPAPAYDGASVESYWMPYRSLTMVPTRGCYWNKCAFCAMSPTTRTKYRERRPELFLEDIKGLVHNLHVRHFMLNADAITPLWLTRFSDLILAEGLDVRWDSEVRLDKHFVGHLERLHRGGCRLLRFGFESGSQEVLDLMHKGVSLSNVRAVIAAAHEADIRVGLEAFFGFPGERRSNAIETLRFIRENIDKISCVDLDLFLLIPGSEVFRRPDLYGVEIGVPTDALRTVYTYTVRRGMSQWEARLFRLSVFMKYRHMVERWGDEVLNCSCGNSTTLLYACHYGTSPIPRSPAFEAAYLNENFREAPFWLRLAAMLYGTLLPREL